MTDEFATPESSDLRSRHNRLLTELEQLRLLVSASGLGDQIEIGSIVRDVDDAFAKLLDNLKEIVREHAQRRLGGEVGRCSLDGSDLGSAVVSVPEPTLRLARGHSADEMRRVLGPAFANFFEETTLCKPTPEFAEHVAALQDEEQRRLVLDAIEYVEGTPRVSFRRRAD